MLLKYTDISQLDFHNYAYAVDRMDTGAKLELELEEMTSTTATCSSRSAGHERLKSRL